MNDFYNMYKDFSPQFKTSMFIVVVLLLLSIIMGRKFKKADPLKPPKGLMFLIYSLVTVVDNFTIDNVGEKRYKTFSPYLFFLVMYLIPAVFLGLFGFISPLTQPAFTVMLGGATYVMAVFGAVKYRGVLPFLGDFTKPFILFLPLNIVGELSKPFSLGMRIFGNILSGTVLMMLIYSVTGMFAIVIAPAGHVIFDIFFGAVQIVVFVLLSGIFISLSAVDEEELE